MKNQTKELLVQKALEYSDRFTVLPANSRKKCPPFSWTEFQTRKPTQEEIVDLFEAYPHSDGLCAITGKHPGYLVIDIDPGSELTPDDFPATLTAITGRGGYHLYYKYPKHEEIKSISGWKKSVDIRANGGLVILPPSVHGNGKSYQWVDEAVPMADLPQSIIDELPKSGASQSKMDTSIFRKPVEEGQRHDTMVRIAGKLFQQTPEDDWLDIVYSSLEALNEKNCNPPLSKQELDNIYYGIAKNEQEARASRGSGNRGEKINPTQLLLQYLQEETELLFNQFGRPCYRLSGKPYVEQLPSSSLNRKLQHSFYMDAGFPVRKDLLKSAIDIHLSDFEQDNPDRTVVHTRIGTHNDFLIYDIGDGKNFIEISKDGWKIINESPIIFVHQQNQLEQVLPDGSGDLMEFLNFLNVTEKDDQLLILVYLVCSLIPNIPRPILLCHGPQGSTKTTILRFLRALIDPARPDIVSPPKDANDMVQLASHNFLLLLDNISHLKEWHSDALCRFVTGDGYSKRALWTTDEDFLYSFMRVVGISGINQVATKPDLLDRSLLIEFERVSPEKRMTERALWSRFQEVKPKLLGGLLNVLSEILATVDQVQLKQPIRLADFHQYAVAAAQALGFSQEDLDGALQRNTIKQNQEALTASAVAQSVIKFMEGKTTYSASSTEVYNKIKAVAELSGVVKDYPKSVTWFWRALGPVEHNLKEVGITCFRSSTTAHSTITIINDGSHIPTEPAQDNTVIDFSANDDFEETTS